MQNNTDIILSQPGALGDVIKKVELDDKPDKFRSFRHGATELLMFPSNPITLALDCICWVSASSVVLLTASLAAPVVFLWVFWCLYLATVLFLPTNALGGGLRLCAGLRLFLVLLGAVALIL